VKGKGFKKLKNKEADKTFSHTPFDEQ